MLPPDPDKPKGLSGFFASLSPLQQGGIVLGGLATLTAVAMPLLFSDGFTLFSFRTDRDRGGAFARKDAPAPKAAAPAPAGEPAASPLPMPGQTLSSVMRPGSGGGPLSAGLAPSGGAPDAGGAAGAGGAGGPGGGAGGRPPGPQGFVTDGGATAGGTVGGNPGRGVALEPTAPLVSIPPGGSSGGGSGVVPAVSVPQGGAAPGEGGIGPNAQHGGGGGGLSSDGGLHEGRQNALQDSDGGGDEDESRCEPSVRARFDAMIDQKFNAYVSVVTDRRSSGCQGIPCSWIEQHPERCAKGKLSYTHHCRCARMACKQDQICKQGNQIRCQKQKACAANPPAQCDGFKCDLDPS